MDPPAKIKTVVFAGGSCGAKQAPAVVRLLEERDCAAGTVPREKRRFGRGRRVSYAMPAANARAARDVAGCNTGVGRD